MSKFIGFMHPESWNNWKDWHIIECYRDLSANLASATVSMGHYLSPYSISSTSVYQLWDDRPKVKKELGFSMSTEVITGWRAWQIVDFERRGGMSEKRLQALGMKPIWEPYQTNVAICTSNGMHEAPWPTCKCGFWAFKKREHVEKALFDQYNGEVGKVIGQVALWGRVLECSHGYRGEYAYPLTFQFVKVAKEVAEEVSNLYGVPYSIIKPSNTFKCEGYVTSTEYDFDRLYVTVQYSCGLGVRVEVSRNFEGKNFFNIDKVPPCPEHQN